MSFADVSSFYPTVETELRYHPIAGIQIDFPAPASPAPRVAMWLPIQSMKHSRIWLTALALLSIAGGAAAQTWPDKPVRIVVPLTAGRATDVMARTVAQRLT